MGERIPRESQTTHIVFLNYSLCCLPPIDKMIGGLNEATRVLIPQGILVNFYPFISQSYLFNQTFSADQMKVLPMFEDKGYDDGYAFKNAVILRGFKLLIEECITIKSFYRTQSKAREQILTGRSVNYLKIDQLLNHLISGLIERFVMNQEKPIWFPFNQNENFTIICQIFVKTSQLTKN